MLTTIDYSFIADDSSFNQVQQAIKKESTLSIYLEFDDWYNYDVQMSVFALATTSKIYLIDLHRVDISPLKNIMADPNTIKICYDSPYMIRLMQTRLGWSFRSIIDTKDIFEEIKSDEIENTLAHMIKDQIGQSLPANDQGHRRNYSQRPLPEEFLLSIAAKVAYLRNTLATMQKSLSEEQQRVLESYFRQLPLLPNLTDTPLIRAFQICHENKVSNPVDRLLIFRLNELRVRIGERKDISDMSVITKKDLVVLISRKPRNVEELRKFNLFSGLIKDYHQQILELMNRTMSNKTNDIDPEGKYQELDEKFMTYYPYHDYLTEDYEWPYEPTISQYKNRRAILRIIYNMISWKMDDRYMHYLLTEALLHQLAANPAIRLDQLRPKIDACKTVDDITTFINQVVEEIYQHQK